ncbi:unnamed protein product [Paramecium sonneborni]|uniref:Uncharacterized protein n=1 Tax=Paramecium sonneborni TaxID=65129 RepID=A0A8S1LEQ4_9CILI|nr:unnamed protein product [Paramecium sonneborni]
MSINSNSIYSNGNCTRSRIIIISRINTSVENDYLQEKQVL